MRTQMKKFLGAILAAASVCAVFAQSSVRGVAGSNADGFLEKREQAAAPGYNQVKKIFALAKTSAEEDFNVDFCGFFAGMSRYDAMDLAAYYRLKEGEYRLETAWPGKAVYRLWFSLKGVRRITKGGNTIEELAQAVANRVGDLKGGVQGWERKTIDGVVVIFGERGLIIQNNQLLSKAPIATAEAARKDKADVDAAEKEKAARERAAKEAAEKAAAEKAARERAAREEAARKERAAKEAWMKRWGGATKTLRLPGGATMEMIPVAPGSFTMGSPEWEEGRDNDETQHHVTLTKGFWLGKYEVTQAQWKSVMGNNPSEFKGDNLPVENVSWDDCQEFIRKVNAEAERQFGGEARLPTEAEWEYACRAGSTGAFAGTGDLDSMGWYWDNSGHQTHPVGQKRPNAWGFYDMHGNVWERCSDWYGSYPGDSVTDPVGPASGGLPVDRGGSWGNIARQCRSASRGRGNPGFRYWNSGFRLACSAGPRGKGAEQ